MKRPLLLAGLLAAVGTGTFLLLKTKRAEDSVAFDPARGLPQILGSRIIPNLLSDSPEDPGNLERLVAAYRRLVTSWRPEDAKSQELRRQELLVIGEIEQLESVREKMLGVPLPNDAPLGNIHRVSRQKAWAEYADGERHKLASMLKATRLLASR